MAKKVTVQVVGGKQQTVDGVTTIGELKRQFGVPNHVATLNGDSVGNETSLADYSFVHLAPAVKGGI